MTVLKQTPRDVRGETQSAREAAGPNRNTHGADTAKPAEAQADRFDVTRLSAREIALELARNSRSDRPATPPADPAAISWQALPSAQPAATAEPAGLSPAERQRAKTAYVEERYRREEEEQARLRAEELRQGLRQSLRQGYRDPTSVKPAAKPAPQKSVAPQYGAHQSGPYYSDAPHADHAPVADAANRPQPRYAASQNDMPHHDAPHQETNRFAAQRSFVVPDPAFAPQPDIAADTRREPHFAYTDPSGPQPDYPAIDPGAEEISEQTFPEKTFNGDPALAQPAPAILPHEVMPAESEQPHVLSAFDLPDQPATLLLDETKPPLYRQHSLNGAAAQSELEPDSDQPEPDSPYPAPFPKLLNEVRQLQEARQQSVSAEANLAPRSHAPDSHASGSHAPGLHADARLDRYSADGRHAADLRIPAALSRRDEMVTDLPASRYTGWRNALAATTLLAVLALGPALYYTAHIGTWGAAQSELKTSLDHVLAKTGLTASSQTDPSDAASTQEPATANPAPATTTAPQAGVTAPPAQSPAVAMEPLSSSAKPANAATATAAPASVTPASATPAAPVAAGAAVPVAPPKMAHKVEPREAPASTVASSKPAAASPAPVKSDTRNGQSNDAIADLITAAGGAGRLAPESGAGSLAADPAGTSHLVSEPGAAQPVVRQPATAAVGSSATRKVAPVTGAAWMKAQPYDPDKATAPRAAEASDAPVRDGDGEAVIYDGTPDAWLKRQPYNPGVLTLPAN